MINNRSYAVTNPEGHVSSGRAEETIFLQHAYTAFKHVMQTSKSTTLPQANSASI